MAIPLYNLIETPVEGVRRQYKKAVSGGFYNGKDQTPSLYYNEGLVTIEPDGTITEKDGQGVLFIEYIPGEEFPFRDQDGSIVATWTTDLLYQGLACFYLHKAQQRDADAAAKAIEIPNEE